MKVLIASDSYKNCMTSIVAANAIESGLHRFDASIEVHKYAVGDGGEGTLDAFVHNTTGEMIVFHGKSAPGKLQEMHYWYMADSQTAIIEVAQIIGLKKLSEGTRAPMYYSSFGVGQALLHAKKQGAKKIIVGLGGSSTNDGGMGILQACGAKFYDDYGSSLPAKAKALNQIRRIDLSEMVSFEGIEIIAACDVKNHLLGEQGATYTFGKQKGLFPNQMKAVEKGMVNYATLMQASTGIDLNSFEGGGAAGGIGACLMGVFQAKMISGIELVMQYTDFEAQLRDADLIITGEGQSDHQTMYGKVPVGILRIAQRYDVPTIIISGALGYEYMQLFSLGFAGIFSISDRVMTFEQALKVAPVKLENTSYSVIHFYHQIANRSKKVDA